MRARFGFFCCNRDQKRSIHDLGACKGLFPISVRLRNPCVGSGAVPEIYRFPTAIVKPHSNLRPLAPVRAAINGIAAAAAVVDPGPMGVNPVNLRLMGDVWTCLEPTGSQSAGLGAAPHSLRRCQPTLQG